MADLPRRPSRTQRHGGTVGRSAGGERLRLARYGRAWAQALETARRLVYEFGAARVVAAGALLHPERFDRTSAVELVVWGLRADVFRQALAGGRTDAVPAVIRDGDRLAPVSAGRIRAEGVELARRPGE